MKNKKKNFSNYCKYNCNNIGYFKFSNNYFANVY